MGLVFKLYSVDSVELIGNELAELVKEKSFLRSPFYGWVNGSKFYLAKRPLANGGLIVKIYGEIQELGNKNEIMLEVKPGLDFYITGLIILLIVSANLIIGDQIYFQQLMIVLGWLSIAVFSLALVMWLSVNAALETVRKTVRADRAICDSFHI